MTVEHWLIVGLTAALVLLVVLAVRRPVADRRPAPGAPTSGGPRRTALAEVDLLAMADAADVGLLRVGADGVIVLANRVALALVGRPSGVLKGLSTMEAFVDHRVDDLVEEARRHGFAQGELLFAGEPQRSLLVIARRDAADDGLWLILRDLSELRRLQRIRSEFLDNLSHELRTPLANVRLVTESLGLELERSDVPARIREGIERIDIETGHLVQMVTELLDLARIEQGDRQLRRDRVDLAQVAGNAVDRLRPYAERQDVKVRTEMPARVEERAVTGDAERLEQLLINLLHNAVKFSPAGGEVTVRLAARRDVDEVRLVVEDRGPGIPRRDLERVFERFYKVDRARARAGAGGGTGLGLSIARHIAEGHGGRIWAESEEGGGARLIVALPSGAVRSVG